MDLVSQAIISWGMVVTIVTRAKERLYHDWHLMDVSILLVTKVFGCLHQYVDDIFH
jgi:hypothetical protein